VTEMTIITLAICRDSTVCVRRARCHDVKALESTVPGTRLRHLDRDASACIAGRGETDCLNNYTTCGGSREKREGEGKGKGGRENGNTECGFCGVIYGRQFEEGKNILKVLYEGTGGNVCHTALSSAKQNSATAYATGHLAQPLQRRCDKHYLLHLRSFYCSLINRSQTPSDALDTLTHPIQHCYSYLGRPYSPTSAIIYYTIIHD
jgi:hypothetical protein